MTAVDLSWILEENKISTGCRRGAAFLWGPGAGPSGRAVQAESRISITEAGDSSGGASEDREREMRETGGEAGGRASD